MKQRQLDPLPESGLSSPGATPASASFWRRVRPGFVSWVPHVCPCTLTEVTYTLLTRKGPGGPCGARSTRWHVPAVLVLGGRGRRVA